MDGQQTALVPVRQERGLAERIEALAKAGSAVLVFGAYAALIGGGIYLAYRGLKKIGWL